MTREELQKQEEEALETIKKMKEKAINSPDKDKYKCPICKDAGFLYFNFGGQDTQYECECTKKRMAIRRLEMSGIAEEDRSKTLADYITFGEKPLIDAKSTVQDYMSVFKEIKDTRTNSLLLMGRSGSGKTMLGIIAAMDIINNHALGLKYYSYRTMIAKLKQKITDEYEYNSELYKIISSSVLFIDDLFKGKITGSDINIMYEIINTRYLERKPIIISTECDIERLLNIDEAIGSRIIEMSKGHIVMFDNSTINYRLRY